MAWLLHHFPGNEQSPEFNPQRDIKQVVVAHTEFRHTGAGAGGWV